MRGRILRIVVPLLILGILAVPAAAQDGGDAVKLKAGGWLIDQYPADATPTPEEMKDGKIVVLKEEYDFLHYRFRAVPGNQRTPMEDVDYVLYFQRDATYDRAAKAMNAGDYEGALAAFQEAVNSRVPWVPQYAMWNIVSIHVGLGQPQEALAAIDELIRKFPRTKYLIDARKEAGRIRLALGDVAGARGEYTKIRAIRGIPDSVGAEVDYWLIYIEEKQAGTDKGTLEGVMKKYEAQLREVRGKYKNVETKCRLGIGRCLVALERHQEALEYFEKITKESKDPEVLAGAYLMIGEAYFAMEKWVDARRAYLRVCVLWDQFPDIHAQALCRAGNCFLLTRDKDYKIRAAQELQRCYKRYPGSPWAQEAKDLESTIR